MYGPALGVKQKLEIVGRGSAKMYPTYWWSELLAMMRIRVLKISCDFTNPTQLALSRRGLQA